MSSGQAEATDQTCRLTRWLTDKALPLWSSVGIADDGGFYECLTLDGKPQTQAIRRLRVQARQIYVFSHATVLGLGDWREICLKGFDWLIRYGHDEKGGGFVHRLDGHGAVADTLKDTYDHAFVLMSLAWLYRATGESTVAEWIDKTVDFLDRRLKAPAGGGYWEALPHRAPRRQNPHMHLLEAFMALYEATGDEAYLERAGQMVSLFQNHFFDRTTATVTEFFDDDWSVSSDDAGQYAEPGHLYEWFSLLTDYAAKTGETLSPEALQCFESAERIGLDARAGLAVDEVWKDGRVKRATKRCWPQTEALRAHLLMGAMRSDQNASAQHWIDAIFARYLDPAPEGAWLDVLGPLNEPAATAIPASTFYHLMSAFACVLERPKNLPNFEPLKGGVS